MSSAAVTLQCPACGGVFLTLQQGTGGAETCPHCTQSAPRERYHVIEAQGGSIEPAYAPLPAPPASAPQQPVAARTSPAQLWEAALLQQQQAQNTAPAFTGPESVKAGAPDSSQEASPPLPLPVPPEPVTFGPVASTTTGPLPPPQIGFVPPATSELTPTVFQPHPHVQAAASVARPVSPFGIAGTGTDAVEDPAEPPPLPAPPGLSVHIAPPLPGVVPHHEHAVNPHHHEASAHATPHAAQDLALVAVKMMRNSGPPTVVHHPPSRAPWIAGLIFGSLALAGGLHFIKERWQPAGTTVAPLTARSSPSSLNQSQSKPNPVPESKETIPSQQVAAVKAETAPNPTPEPTPVPPAASTTPTEVSSQATVEAATSTPPLDAPAMQEVHVATTTKPEAMPAAEALPEIVALPVPSIPPSPPPPSPTRTPGPAAPQEEVRLALPADTATLTITKQDTLHVIAAKLVFGIDTATTPEERARWIAEPEKHSADMEQMVKMHGGRLHTREVEPLPISGPVHALPSGEAVALFRVNSPTSRGGAIVRLHTTANGNHVIDWPLFAQTYDNAFDHFVAAHRASPGEAEWHTVLCNLIGDPNTKNAREEPRLMLKVQGSLAETGAIEAWVEKNSPVGQYLQKEMTLGHTYLIDLQISAPAFGNPRLQVIDCSATRDDALQSNENK